MLIEQPAKWLRWLYPRATWRMDSNERSVYITFDDGPIPESTPFILKTLREHNVKATFFMVGENVLRHHDLYNQIIADGHQVGDHLFRPPHGWMRHSVYWWLSKKYRIIMWDLVTRDYSKWLTAKDVVNNVKRYTRNGSIITFHDSLKSIDKLQTALPEALTWLKEQGYEFKTFE